MKVNKLICIIAVFGICVNFSMAQNRTFEDIALDYLKERLNKQSNGLKSDETKYYELPNGNMIVLMHVKWSDGYIEDSYDTSSLPGVHGNYLTPQGWVHSDVVVKRTELTGRNRYAVFVSRTGTPLTYFLLPEEYDIVPIKQGYVCFLFDKSVQNVGGKSTPFYNNVICRDYEGNRLWGFPNDLIAFDIVNTENNLYISGEIIKEDGAYSLVRTVEIKTGKTKDHIGKKGDIALGVMNIDEGIQVTEYRENGALRNYVLPYEDNDKDFQFKEIMKTYNQSKASDQVSIGERYLKGKGFPKDQKKAFEWFQKAANQNDCEGLYKLGCCYLDGYGVMQDKITAVNYFEKSANLHNTDAIIILSDMYAEGNGIEKNMSKALYWKEMLAFNGNLNAQKYVLANQSMEYEKIDLTADEAFKKGLDSHKEKSYEWAKFCFERAIKLGSKDAMLFYGEWLYSGDGISKDCNKAIEYLTKLGEEDNNKYAQKMLGLIYHENKGIAPDIKKEMYWTAKAADNGDVDSQLKLGYAYHNGIGVKKNKKLEFAMFEKAAQQGNQTAIKELIYCYVTGRGVKKDEEQCIVWFKKMNIDNQLVVADDFENNPKIKCKLGTIINMYEQLARQNHYGAMKKYAELSVRYCSYNEAVEALNLMDRAKNIAYSTKNADTYMLWGELHERQGKIGQAIECYRNSGTTQGRERADMLNRRR